MAYRIDPDLAFLSQIPSANLSDLVYVLIYDKDGKKRMSETLTSNARYEKYAPQHTKYWQEIAAEIQCFGAHSLVTLFRGGKGVLYEEVLKDVCDKLKVDHQAAQSVVEIENQLFIHFFSEAIKEMKPEQVQQLEHRLNLKDKAQFTPENLVKSLQHLFEQGDFKSYQIMAITANQIMKALNGRGIQLGALSLLVLPMGLPLAGLLGILSLAAPAYRVTIPAVIEIALLRRQLKLVQEHKITFEAPLLCLDPTDESQCN